jgi:hypothetical protein
MQVASIYKVMPLLRRYSQEKRKTRRNVILARSHCSPDPPASHRNPSPGELGFRPPPLPPPSASPPPPALLPAAGASSPHPRSQVAVPSFRRESLHSASTGDAAPGSMSRNKDMKWASAAILCRAGHMRGGRTCKLLRVFFWIWICFTFRSRFYHGVGPVQIPGSFK